MDKALADIKKQLAIAKTNLDAALSRATHLNDKGLIQNIHAAEQALLAIHKDEEDEERLKNSEFRELMELEDFEKKQENLLAALQKAIKRQ